MTRPPKPKKLHVHQGQFVIGRDPDVVLRTILGSCVAACIYDPQAKVGGMNHFLLPEAVLAPGSLENRHGIHLMELLLNGLLKAGACRTRLRAKLFGGARVVQALSNIGARNAEFARKFLEHEGIPVEAESLNGDRARRVEFWPATGRSRQMTFELAPPAKPTLPAVKHVGEVELF